MNLIRKIFSKKPKLLQGYYSNNIHLTDTDSKKTDTYTYIAYVSELERYKNNLSKIKLNSVEIESGVSVDQYFFIKKCVVETFISIVDTNKIHWLEPNITLKDERKEKLKQIGKK